MAPEAKRNELLYVSDYSSPYRSNDVLVYSYPQGKLVGKLTGFTEPAGECVDSAGNVSLPTLAHLKFWSTHTPARARSIR
jgi:hypothetical protein